MGKRRSTAKPGKDARPARTRSRAGVEDVDRARLEDAHHQLELARDRYAELYDSSPVPLLTVDGIGIIREISEAAMDLFGVSRTSLLGLPLASLAIDGDRSLVRRHVQRCHSRINAGPVVTEVAVVVALGAVQTVQMMSRRVGGQRESYVTALIDLTEKKRSAADRQSLLDAERDALTASNAKDLFISVLSHELRAPLTAMAAVAVALEREAVSGDQLLGLAQILRRNTAAQSRLIDDLMDVTRVIRRKMNIDRQPTDLHAIVHEALGTLKPEIGARGLDVTVELGAELHHVLGDWMRLRQVFWNLLHNAVKFTPLGGTIRLRSWNPSGNRQGRIVVEVDDDGAGIDAALLAQIFQPFEQGASRGSPLGLGLGLAITKGIVELHEGQIFAASPGRGQGSRFLVELAVCAAESQAAHEIPLAADAMAARHGLASPPRILLVEDNADIAHLLADDLRRAGYQVDVGSSVSNALGKNLDEVDLVISDVQLPDGTGLDLLRRLQAGHDLTAIAVSGCASPDDVRASLEAGFFAHLKKPIDTSDLLAVIAAAIRKVTPSRARQTLVRN